MLVKSSLGTKQMSTYSKSPKRTQNTRSGTECPPGIIPDIIPLKRHYTGAPLVVYTAASNLGGGANTKSLNPVGGASNLFNLKRFSHDGCSALLSNLTGGNSNMSLVPEDPVELSGDGREQVQYTYA